jgi:branched-chain amino acid transport system ATP-binding protein
MLEVRGVSAGYGHVRVLFDVDLHVSEGEVVTLIGANGAGKSTLLRAIAGLLPVWTGEVFLDGVGISGLDPHRRVDAGVALVPEGRMLFGPMTVDENLHLGAYRRPKRVADEIEADRELVFDLFPVLSERRTQAAETLSGGEQQMLAIGRALMSRPRLLLLDEPSLGLAPMVIREIFGVLDHLRARGLTIFLIEQDARIALKHADRGYVMRTGTIALSGTAKTLMADDDVRLIYLGAWHDEQEGDPA